MYFQDGKGPFLGKSNRVEKLWTKLWEEAASMAKKTFDIFKRLGRNEPFWGKNMVKKRNIMPIRGKLRNFFPFPWEKLGKA